MRHFSFDIIDNDDHLDIVSCDAVHFASSCHEGLSHDETFGTDDLDPPPPFDLNIPAHVDEYLDSDNAPLENAVSIGEDIHNDDSVYDVDFSENEEASDYADVMIDEENEIHEAEVEVHLFGLRESNYQFTSIGVSSEVPDNVFIEKDGHEMDIDDFDTDSGGEGDCPGGKRSALNKLKKAFMQGEGDVNPEIPGKVVQDLLQRELEVHILMSKSFRAKAKADKEIKGDHYLQYHKLRDYVVELQSTNPNTIVLRLVKREILELDGAFMKGPYPGQVLTTMGIDANNGIYPVAYALVEVETKNSWCWFLQCLGDDLNLQPNSNFTFISNRQKGIIPSIKHAYPSAKHRFSATTTVAFERCMNELKSLNV
ncbi:transposase, MuDR, MULE transposase domain protein [Tanacetum coccineum]